MQMLLEQLKMGGGVTTWAESQQWEDSLHRCSILETCISKMKPKQPHFQIYTPHQNQHRLLSVDHACGTENNMCVGCMVNLVWLVGL